MTTTDDPRLETVRLEPGDNLQVIFDTQREFQGLRGFDFTTMTDEQRVEYVRTYVLAAVDELCEALHETQWKPWKQWDGELAGVKDPHAYKEELADVLHFLVNLCLVAEMDAGEFATRFHAKQLENRRRLEEGY